MATGLCGGTPGSVTDDGHSKPLVGDVAPRRCALRHQDHEVRGLRSGRGWGLVVSIALANTVCATTRPRRRRCAAHQEDRQLIKRAGRGSAGQSRAVQSWQMPRQRPPAERRHTAGATPAVNQRPRSGHRAAGQPTPRAPVPPPSTRVTASSRRCSALAATQSCPGEPWPLHNSQSLTMQNSQSLDSWLSASIWAAVTLVGVASHKRSRPT